LQARPNLRYLEYHLVEHCNLDCTGCGHFSPFAEEQFADPESFDKDLAQLARLFGNIGKIRLMGGEPLLHPDPGAFVRIARQHFPASDLRVVTNGILLKKIGSSFWEACREAGATIDLSLYPALHNSRQTFERICASNLVRCSITSVEKFLIGINPQGDSVPREAMDYCRSLFYCPFLHDSRLHVCAMPAMVHYFNERFGRNIPGDSGIDLFEEGLTGEEVLRRLGEPVSTCAFCSCSYRPVQWRHAPAAVQTPGDYEV